MNEKLVINSGSSSIKMALFNEANKEIYAISESWVKNFESTFEKVLKKVLSENPNCKISKIGHRIVHGGEKFRKTTLMNAKNLKEIEKLSSLAPLHNPINLKGVVICQKILPNAKNYGIFDTAFYADLPEKSYLYAIPYSLYKKHKIRKYGFHGISHEYASKQIQKKFKKIISIHLGNGCSITAINNGKAVETSMGFTPLDGLPMGERSGSIDPAIIFYLEKNGYKLSEIKEILEKESGLKGISEISNDMRDLWKFSNSKISFIKRPKAKKAMSIFCYKIAQFIGAYAASLNGVEAIIFTGAIGENAHYIRKEICEYLSFMGIKIDEKKNKANASEINSKNSNKIFVIKANEAKAIAEKI